MHYPENLPGSPDGRWKNRLLSVISPQWPGWKAEKSSLIRSFSPAARMRRGNAHFCPYCLSGNVTGWHKAIPASLQVSLAGIALNRWLSYLPSVVLADQ